MQTENFHPLKEEKSTQYSENLMIKFEKSTQTSKKFDKDNEFIREKTEKSIQTKQKKQTWKENCTQTTENLMDLYKKENILNNSKEEISVPSNKYDKNKHQVIVSIKFIFN